MLKNNELVEESQGAQVAYEAPDLIVYGDVRSLVMGHGPAAADGYDDGHQPAVVT